MHYDAKTGKLKCDYCDSVFSLEEIKKLYAEKNEQAAQNAAAADAKPEKEEEWSDQTEGMKGYSCPSCGAELVCNESTAAASCPYCGNPTIMPGQFSMKKPNYVIPFKVEKKEAKAKLQEYYRGKRFLPKSFADENHVEEIQGVYVPFWMFTERVQGDMSFEGIKQQTRRSGQYEITRKDYFDVRRKGLVSFEKIPVDAAKSMPDDLMDSIEPFNYEDLKPFEMEYLPGYLANKYDVETSECESRAKQRAENSTAELLRQSVQGYNTVNEKNRNIQAHNVKTEYGMLPVWLLSSKWQDQNFLFAINGQTGRMTGDLPSDPKKIAAWFAGITAITALIVMAVLFLMGDFDAADAAISIVMGAIISALVCLGMQKQMKPVARKTTAAGYVKQNEDGSSSPVKFSIRDDAFVRTVEEKRLIENRQTANDHPGVAAGGPGMNGGQGRRPGPRH